MRSAADAPALESIALTLSRGLRLATSYRALRRGIRVAGAHVLRLRHGTLIVTLATNRRRIALTVATPALLETPGLVLAAQGDRSRRQPLRLRIHAVATDSAGDRTALTLTSD